jgi:hypothetical protein
VSPTLPVRIAFCAQGGRASAWPAQCYALQQFNSEIAMRNTLVLLAILSLAGCGADVATTAGTAAVVKKQEIEQGQKSMEQAQQKVGQAMDQMQQSAQRADDAANK